MMPDIGLPILLLLFAIWHYIWHSTLHLWHPAEDNPPLAGLLLSLIFSPLLSIIALLVVGRTVEASLAGMENVDHDLFRKSE
jgi:Zn-dependent protease